MLAIYLLFQFAFIFKSISQPFPSPYSPAY